eukprot:629990-Lingulodinium_polyedra.AAC.1
MNCRGRLQIGRAKNQQRGLRPARHRLAPHALDWSTFALRCAAVGAGGGAASAGGAAVFSKPPAGAWNSC